MYNLKNCNFIILLPLYNDWENLKILIKKIKKIKFNENFNYKILVIDDCSKTKSKKKIQSKNIKILRLYKNFGSQRAIAIGLKYIFRNFTKDYKFTIIMDSDGQDDPKILKKMIQLFNLNEDEAVVVQRTNRKEQLWFRILYKVYKIIFLMFVCKQIKFGNFSLINNKYLFKVIDSNDLWAAYPATIIKNFKKIKKINYERLKRYKGITKMNLIKLFDHALRVFSVFKTKILFISLLYLIILLNIFGTMQILIISIFFVLNLCLYIRYFINSKNLEKNSTKIKKILNTIS